MELYAGIVIEVDHYGLDNIFTYKVPEDLYEEVSIMTLQELNKKTNP